MIFREATPADFPAVLRLSLIPMPGKIPLIWGLHRVEPPPDCDHLRTFILDQAGEIRASAMSWDWPDGQRYLGGLRIEPHLRGRVARSFWTKGYEAGLAGAAQAWTCVGAENTSARRLLLSGRRWLPCYSPRQELRSWFVPLPAHHRRAVFPETACSDLGLQADDHRFAAIGDGCGIFYRLARLSHALGLPGLPRPGQRIRIAHAGMPPEHFARCRRSVKGLEGILVTVPRDSELAQRWKRVLPRYASVWDSTLYSVHWDADAPLPPIPAWKGAWL